MAKLTHSVQVKGTYDHAKRVIAEYDKKTEATTYYSLDDILTKFDGEELMIAVKTEDEVPSIESPSDLEE